METTSWPALAVPSCLFMTVLCTYTMYNYEKSSGRILPTLCTAGSKGAPYYIACFGHTANAALLCLFSRWIFVQVESQHQGVVVLVVNCIQLGLGISTAVFLIGMAVISIKHSERVHNHFAKLFTFSSLLHQASLTVLTKLATTSLLMFYIRLGITVAALVLILSMLPIIAMDANRRRAQGRTHEEEEDSLAIPDDVQTNDTGDPFGDMFSDSDALLNKKKKRSQKTHPVTIWATLQVLTIMNAAAFYLTFIFDF